ncbi:hypothetical protein QO004_002828 [Rhizobium mesoamericanum]|nr:hypothetical protein [Rhizobium mesoamericanum]
MTDSRFFELSANWSAAGSEVAEISLRLGDRVLSRIADTEKNHSGLFQSFCHRSGLVVR